MSESLEDILQADDGVRSAARDRLFAALKAVVAAEGPEAARTLALRAVTPLADYSFLMRLRRSILRPKDPEGALRLAVLGGPTTTQLTQLLALFLAADGVEATIHESEYGLFRQEILTEGSGLDRFRPQVILLATTSRDVARWPSLVASAPEAEGLAAAELGEWRKLWEVARERWGAAVIQNTFEAPSHAVLGHLSGRVPGSRERHTQRLNRLLFEESPAWVVLHDLGHVSARVGAERWFDPRLYHEAKMPCGPDGLVEYAASVASLVRALRGKSRKVLVLDLDNTLWGGVVGDLGAGGIRFGQGSGEGEAFLAIQEWALSLHERGVVLAVCSKNDEVKAREPFETRSDMVLRMGHFSAFIANWRNKADNLREIASRLNLGLDSFVFVDDNPAERALVRRLVPAVAVPSLPEDPAQYVDAVSRFRYFETVTFSAEDASRARYYEDERKREQLAGEASDLGSFLVSLRMVARVEPVGPLNLERATQLVNKSNQFNLTTRRTTVLELESRASDPGWITLTISLRDALGDSGLIAVLVLRRDGDSLEVDTWVMSCRVLSRGVEQLTRNELVRIGRESRARRILGTFIPTERNGLVRDLYPSLGFLPRESPGGPGTSWEILLTEDLEALPTHIGHERQEGSS